MLLGADLGTDLGANLGADLGARAADGKKNPNPRSSFAMECRCGGGPCREQPVILNPRFVLVCCPKDQAGGHGGCGFMQWRDTKEPDNTVTWNHPPPPPPPDHSSSLPLPYQDAGGAAAAAPPPHADAKADGGAPGVSREVPRPAPPSWPELVCPCGAGACSVALAKNGRNYYFCSACKFRKWCDEGSSSACFLCRKEGHWSKDCPQLPPAAAAAAASNKTICFNCRKEGHYAAQCPSKRRRRN